MPAGDPKISRYVSPGNGAESGLQSHAYRETARTDPTTGEPVLAPEVQVLELTSLPGFVDGLEGLLTALTGRLPTALDTDGALKVADVFTDGETLPSQAGAGAVLTFTFASPVDLVWVRSVGEVSYCDPFGGVPANGTGIYLSDDEPAPITVRTSSVKVWAPSGATVHCWGYGG